MLRTPYRHRVPLGLTLLSKGQVSKANLESALTLQHEHGGRLGKCLQEVYGIPEAVITAAVAEQWNMPAFHGDAPSSVPAELLPASLVRELDILPVHWNPASRTLLLGFPQAVEFALMAAIERVLGCRVEACIVGDSLFRAGACACDASVGSTIRFAAHTTASETVEIILNYLERTGCRDLRAAHAPDFYWARLAGAPIDLLFDLPHA